MVHLDNATPAYRAVVCADRLECFTALAEATVLVHPYEVQVVTRVERIGCIERRNREARIGDIRYRD